MDDERDHIVNPGDASAEKPPRRGPAQPGRVRWQQTLDSAERVNDGEPSSERTDEAESSQSRHYGPPPPRRTGRSRVLQPAPLPEGADDPDESSLLSLARPTLITGTVLTVLALLVLLMALFAVTQAIVFYNEIAVLPGWLRPFGYGLLGLLSILILYFGGRVVWLYVKLRVSPRLSLAADDLQLRDQARDELREQRLADARETLTGFLQAYGLSRSEKAALLRLGADETTLDQLESTRHVLIARHAVSDHVAWLQRFQHEFLEPLDGIARRHTRRLIAQVFVGTSIAPRGALDTMVVLTLCYRLIADLCVIYRVRAGRWETALMLAHIMVNLLTASQMDELGDEIGTQAEELLNVSFDALPGVLSGFLSQFVGRSAEGGVNGLLLWRLSVRAQNYLRPIRKRPEPSTSTG